jgi:hypothetical protein
VQKVVTTVALLSLLSLLPSRTLAWHGPDHMTVAKIAYEELKTTVSLLEMPSSVVPKEVCWVIRLQVQGARGFRYS